MRAEQVADAIADLDVGYALADRLDHADGIRAEPVGQRHRVAAGAEVDVDEVHGDEGVAHARLAGPGLADVDSFELEDLGTAGLIQANGSGHLNLSCKRATSDQPVAVLRIAAWVIR